LNSIELFYKMEKLKSEISLSSILTSKMEKETMEKAEVERELACLLERTFAWEDELNSLLQLEN
jgi:hypothetical protein